MTFSRIYLDANILIAALGGDAASEIAVPLLNIIGNVGTTTNPPFVTSELTIAEALVREGNDRQEQGYDNALTSSGWLDVVPVSRGVLWAAASLRARYRSLKLPDAIHLATALAANCPSTLTADMRLSGHFQAGAFRSGQWIEGTNVTEVIRPDSVTLNSILAWLRA